jgi:hypothetical protein
LRHPIIVDGRNLLSPEEMRKPDFTYLSIGRPDVIPSEVNRHASAAAVASSTPEFLNQAKC